MASKFLSSLPLLVLLVSPCKAEDNTYSWTSTGSGSITNTESGFTFDRDKSYTNAAGQSVGVTHNGALNTTVPGSPTWESSTTATGPNGQQTSATSAGGATKDEDGSYSWAGSTTATSPRGRKATSQRNSSAKWTPSGGSWTSSMSGTGFGGATRQRQSSGSRQRRR